MQLAARPYAMAGAAFLGAGVLIAPPAAPPPLPLPVESVQVQLDQAFVPGAIIGQIVTNVIGDTVLLAGNTFIGFFGPPPSGLIPSLIQAPITFVTELIDGTPFLNALGDGLALPIVALLNLGHDIVAPTVFIFVRATEALFAAGQGLALFSTEPFATALAEWQQAILTVLQTPLPPGSGPAAATTLSAAAATPAVTAATNKSVSAATVSSPAPSTVASVPAPVKTTLTNVAALTPKPQLHTVTTSTGTPVTGSLLKTATTGNTAAVSSSTPNKVGVGHPTGGKSKKN